MKLATIKTENGTRAAVVEHDAVQLLAFADAGELLRNAGPGFSIDALPRHGERSLDEVELAPPVLRPEKIICVGLNYHAHAEEAGLAIPTHPLLFPKYAGSLLGATDSIRIPPETAKCDWEAELAVVIGEPVRRASPKDALSAIAGYTVMNDITMRDWQKHTSQFMAGKTFEASTPVGPWIVTPDEVDHARDLKLECTVNGRVMQSGTTADMIFPVEEVISYVSTIITLMPGDVIALGTPAGVGSLRAPQLFLRPGDEVVTECEGIGALRNRCVAEDLAMER